MRWHYYISGPGTLRYIQIRPGMAANDLPRCSLTGEGRGRYKSRYVKASIHTGANWTTSFSCRVGFPGARHRYACSVDILPPHRVRGRALFRETSIAHTRFLAEVVCGWEGIPFFFRGARSARFGSTRQSFRHAEIRKAGEEGQAAPPREKC